jgi:hypothetical protein
MDKQEFTARIKASLAALEADLEQELTFSHLLDLAGVFADNSIEEDIDAEIIIHTGMGIDDNERMYLIVRDESDLR